MARLPVFLDTETTGLGGGRGDAIVQIGAAFRHPETREIQTWGETCNPGEKFYANGRAREAFAINRLTETRVRASRTAAAVASDLRNWLAGAKKLSPFEFWSYNLDFDRPFLEDSPWEIPGPWGGCVMLEAAAAMGMDVAFPKLQRAVEEFAVDLPEGRFHDATTDAVAALLLYEAIRERRERKVRRLRPQGPGGVRIDLSKYPNLSKVRSGSGSTGGHS
ncbi:MAG: 3'-5' exonuclease [Thermoplasmatota archaeon]